MVGVPGGESSVEAHAKDASTTAAGDEPVATRSPRSGVFVVVLSGLSGSGKTTALHALEDAGFFCIDNLPTALIRPFLRLSDDNPGVMRVALSIDVRERLFESDDKALVAELDELERQKRLSVLYLETDDEALINRFKTTRRPHPLITRGISATLADAFAFERRLLEPFRERASLVVDTTDITVHDLRKRITAAYGESATAALKLGIISFGYRNGLPPEADFVFDVRFLDNPFFRVELRDKTGLDPEVSDFVLSQSAAMSMLAHIMALLEDVIPLVELEGRATLTVAIGCTGGHHRSVALAVALRDALASSRRHASIQHRDIPRGTVHPT